MRRLSLRLLPTTLLLGVGCALCLMAQDNGDQDDQGEFSGPAILSRGDIPTTNANTPLAFRPYVGLSGIYDDGLLPVSVNSSGQVPVTDAFGLELNLGLYGYHAWKHTTLSLDYRGDFRDYSQATNYDGSDQFLSLILTNEPNRRTKFTVRSQGGTYSVNSFLSSIDYLSSNYLQTPQNDIFDNRVVFLSTSGDMTYQQTARLSFDIGGEGDLVRRQSSALYGVTQAIGRGDVQYRITKYVTIGADYRYMDYDFTRGFGYTHVNSAGFNFSVQFTRSLALSARIGGARYEGLSLEQVAIAPAIAAILGITEGVQAAYRQGYVPDTSVRLTNTWRHATLSANYAATISPGNGVYLTSRQQYGSASYSYTGVRNWNFGVDTSYNRLGTLTQTLGTFSSYGAGGGATRSLGRGLYAVTRFDARRYNIANSYYLHPEYRVSVGMNWAPGELPLSIW